MNKLSTEKRAQILHCIVEGNSLRATARLTDTAINTVVNLMIEAGKACSIYQDVSGHSKPATKGRMKTSHFEGGIVFGAAWAALVRNERTQCELAAFDINFGAQRLVQPADCA